MTGLGTGGFLHMKGRPGEVGTRDQATPRTKIKQSLSAKQDTVLYHDCHSLHEMKAVLNALTSAGPMT